MSETKSQGLDTREARLSHMCEHISYTDSGEEYRAILALLLNYLPYI